MTRTRDKVNPDATQGQTIDGATGKPDPTPAKRRVDLSSLRDVRLELAAVYRMMDRGEIESQDGTRRAYVLRAIGDIIEMAELERRIADLEARQVAPGDARRALPRLPVAEHLQ
jgi:hypothetical protein